jgi:hypothetical protein
LVWLPGGECGGDNDNGEGRATMDRRATLGVMCGVLSLDSLRAVNAFSSSTDS